MTHKSLAPSSTLCRLNAEGLGWSVSPAGAHAHVLHRHGDGGGGALLHRAEVDPGWQELEAPQQDGVGVGQRDAATRPQELARRKVQEVEPEKGMFNGKECD